MTRLGGIPENVLTADLDEGTVTLHLPASVYPRDAVYAASFAFIDLFWVFIDEPSPGRYHVSLTPKEGPAAAPALEAAAGRFANELLAAAYRARLTEQNQATIELVTRRALGSAMGPPSLDELEQFDFSDDPFEDPLGIAASWEERFAKKDAAKGLPDPEGGRGGGDSDPD
jgi:His-Xaa-Ser system protein HxsD